MIKDRILKTAEATVAIYKTLYSNELIEYSPDALIRVFVHLAVKNDWSLEKIQNETSIAVKYYYAYEKSKE